MSKSITQLRAATDEELIAEHDQAAVHTVTGVQYYLDELRRRDQAREAAAMEKLARRSFWLRVSSTALAIVATIAAVIALFS